MNVQFSPTQLDTLRKEYGSLETFSVNKLDDFRRLLGKMTVPMLRQLAAADIKFVSKLAGNELLRRGESRK